MWTLAKKFTFEASHQLPKHDGKCARLHGHSWAGYVICSSSILKSNDSPKAGMITDYSDISKMIDPLVEEKLDHYHLNESTGLDNPTSEELARWIYERIVSHRPMGVTLEAIVIEETCTSRCEDRP